MTTVRYDLDESIDSIERLISVWNRRLDSARQSQDSRLIETAQKRKRHYETKLALLKKELSGLDELVQSTPLPELCSFCGRPGHVAGPLIAASTKQAALCQQCCTELIEITAGEDFIGASAIHRCSFCGKKQDFEHRGRLLVGSPKIFICTECVGRSADVFTKNR